MKRGQGGKGYREAYLPHLPKRIQWFGERTAGGVRPIPLHRVGAAFRSLKGASTIETLRIDGGKVKKQAVLTDEEISRMISILTKAGFREVVFVADRLYEISQGKLVAGKEPIPADSYPIAHGVVPLERKAVPGGRGRPEGCRDCHDKDSPFFTKAQVVNIREFLRRYPELKAPQVLPQMNEWGITRVPPIQ